MQMVRCVPGRAQSGYATSLSVARKTLYDKHGLLAAPHEGGVQSRAVTCLTHTTHGRAGGVDLHIFSTGCSCMCICSWFQHYRGTETQKLSRMILAVQLLPDASANLVLRTQFLS